MTGKQSAEYLIMREQIVKDQAKLINCLGNALEGLAYYAQWDGKLELCGFDAEAGTKNFEPADHALCAYKEWKKNK